mmetsp:Transcript_6096/g.3447  ORF Transcript_6096/g.3447 Transcript_6096/m.3447 type:complete len:200 (+) Transcript_6096:193-792(+)
MKEKKIDAQGQACPSPVLLTKDAIEKEHPNLIKVIVDNEAAKENVCRFLKSQKYKVSFQKKKDNIFVIGKIDENISEDFINENRKVEQKKIMVMITSNRIGHGDDELGSKLMISFLKTIKEMGTELWQLVFVNNGVKLTIKGAESLPILKEYEKAGIHILVCGTCLDYFNLIEKKQVGMTTNMLDIVTALQLADKVINI